MLKKWVNHLGCYLEPHNIERADLNKFYDDISVFDLLTFVNSNDGKKEQVVSILNFAGRSDLSDKTFTLKDETSK